MTNYSPFQLAYLGDSVYETAVRAYLLKSGDMTLKEYNKIAMATVCASSQYKAAKIVEPLLSEEEADVMRRGRNAHCGNVPKSASVEEYRTATGLEALFGYLYINGNSARTEELIKIIMSAS